MVTLKEKFLSLCKKNKVSVKEIAQKLETTEQNIYGLIKKNHINSYYLENFAKILNVPTSYFFNDDAPIKEDTPVQEQKDVSVLPVGGGFDVQAWVDAILQSQTKLWNEERDFYRRTIDSYIRTVDTLNENLSKH